MRALGATSARAKSASRLLLCAAAIATFVVSSPTIRAEPAKESDAAPFEIIRRLEQLQDQIADGDAIAQAAHAKMIEHTAHLFAEAKPSVWIDPRNARALIVYLFSGGSGPAIADVVPPNLVAVPYRTLYTGALTYALGDDETARTVLMPIDARSLANGLGGHLALVQATLCAGQDRSKAIALLDLARLVEPGTLVEEAALRKEMSLIGPTGDIDKFTLLARRYLSAFGHSVYADNFRQLVAATAMQISNADTDAAGLSLSRLAATLDRADQRRLYLAIAHAAIVAGHIRMASLAANEAKLRAEPGSTEQARAEVYLGAATIIGERYDEGRHLLETVSSDRLGLRDQALRASALAVSDVIRRPPTPSPNATPAAQRSDVLAEGERMLATADDILKRATK
jgi:chemotaxis protein MotC